METIEADQNFLIGFDLFYLLHPRLIALTFTNPRLTEHDYFKFFLK